MIDLLILFFAGSRFYKGFKALPLKPFFTYFGKIGQIQAVLLAKFRQFQKEDVNG
jgi:hypothetical protein